MWRRTPWTRPEIILEKKVFLKPVICSLRTNQLYIVRDLWYLTHSLTTIGPNSFTKYMSRNSIKAKFHHNTLCFYQSQWPVNIMVTSKPPPRRLPFKGGSNARGYLNPVMAKTTKTNNSISSVNFSHNNQWCNLFWLVNIGKVKNAWENYVFWLL